MLDISDEVAVGNEVATAINALGGLDVLVNAAAIQLCAHTHEHTLHDWNTTLAINLTGTFLMTRACAARADRLRPRRRGQLHLHRSNFRASIHGGVRGQ